MKKFYCTNKNSFYLFAMSFLVLAAARSTFAQSVKTPVSAAEPYGIDFSSLSGNVVSVSEYRGTALNDLDIYSIDTYENGNLVKSIQHDTNGNPRMYAAYEYNAAGSLISITGHDRNSQRWKYEYIYGANGLQTEEKSYDSSNQMEWRRAYHYTESGKLKRIITYNAKDEVTLTETYQYNDRGFVSATITQYPDEKILKRTIYTYTKGGHIAQEDHFDANGFFERIGYSYTTGGEIISFSSYAKDYSFNSRTTLEYGPQKKIILQTITSRDNSVTKIQYLYDSQGNWIWKYDGQTYSLRKIEYKE